MADCPSHEDPSKLVDHAVETAEDGRGGRMPKKRHDGSAHSLEGLLVTMMIEVVGRTSPTIAGVISIITPTHPAGLHHCTFSFSALHGPSFPFQSSLPSPV